MCIANTLRNLTRWPKVTANIYDQKQKLGKLVGSTFSSCSTLPVFIVCTQTFCWILGTPLSWRKCHFYKLDKLSSRQGFFGGKKTIKIVTNKYFKYTLLVKYIYIYIYIYMIMASSPITSWEIDGETVETVSDFVFGGLQNHYRWWLQPWN